MKRNSDEPDEVLREFRGMFRALGAPRRYRHHPPLPTLQAYVCGDLPDPARPPDDDERERGAWALPEVDLHVARCDRCRSQVDRWRRPSGVFRWKERLFACGGRGSPARVWAWSAASLALVLLAVSLDWSPRPESLDPPPSALYQAAPARSLSRLTGSGQPEQTAAPRAHPPRKYNFSPPLGQL